MDNQTQDTPQTPYGENLVEIRYIGLGGFGGNRRGSVMLFIPASLYEDFIRDKENARVPLLPVPVPPLSEGLYNRRLMAAIDGPDPDGDILEGYMAASGVRIRRIVLRIAPQGIFGLMTVETTEGTKADIPINFEYTIIEAVLAKVPIFIEQKLFNEILSHIKVDARFPGDAGASDEEGDDREHRTAEDDHAEEAEELDAYLHRRISEQSAPMTEEPEIRKQLVDYTDEELMALLDLSLEKEAYEWTDFLKLILSLKKGGDK